MFKLKGKKVLVTGAGGFIGSKVVEVLIAAGAEVFGFHHYRGTGGYNSVPVGQVPHTQHYYSGNICDAAGLEFAIKTSGATIVIHMAASISIPYSYQNPRDVVETNVMGTYNVLQACKNIPGIERVVITSSSEVYGTPDSVPITEEHKLKPQSPYSASKISGDALAKSFYCSFELPVVILRPFNTYGPGQSDRAVIPNVIKQALWSDKVQVGALHPKRDFVYVDDTARAFLLAADPERKINGETIHFGTNEAYSVQEVIDHVRELLNGEIPPIEVSEFRKRPSMSEVLHLQADYTKARKLLDWEPQMKFVDGLKEVISYMRDHQVIYNPKAYAI